MINKKQMKKISIISKVQCYNFKYIIIWQTCIYVIIHFSPFAVIAIKRKPEAMGLKHKVESTHRKN